MEEIKGQKRVVLDIVKENSPIMTQDVKILAMRQGVSCGDRYLRWLKKEGEIFSYKLAGDRTHTWAVTEKLPTYKVYQADEKGQLCMI